MKLILSDKKKQTKPLHQIKAWDIQRISTISNICSLLDTNSQHCEKKRVFEKFNRSGKAFCFTYFCMHFLFLIRIKRLTYSPKQCINDDFKN